MVGFRCRWIDGWSDEEWGDGLVESLRAGLGRNRFLRINEHSFQPADKRHLTISYVAQRATWSTCFIRLFQRAIIRLTKGSKKSIG